MEPSAHPGRVVESGARNCLSAIAEMLQRHGIEPAPERSKKTIWKEFLTRHWKMIVAADFFTVEVWTRRGLQRFIVLFFIELSNTQGGEIAGIAGSANGLWMSQIGRSLTNIADGILDGKRYVIHDRGPLLTAEFLASLRILVLPEHDFVRRELIAHYHGERNHQGLGNRLIVPHECDVGHRGALRRRERLGGMRKYYYRFVARKLGSCREATA